MTHDRLQDALPAALSTGAGALGCRAAAQAVVQQGADALRQYPIERLLPEVRQPGQGLVDTFDAGDLEHYLANAARNGEAQWRGLEA